MTKWLITGITGLLGGNAAAELAAASEIVGVSRHSLSSSTPAIEADISSAGGRSELVARSGADHVFHAAAIASIEECEQNPELAHELNVVASADLAAQAAALGLPFVYISTDAVFNGEDGNYTEESAPSPESEYGRTKLKGERAVLEAHPGALIARVNFYGWSPNGRRSLAEFFHSNLAADRAVSGFTDITVSTMYVGHLVGAINELLRRGASGVYNVVSSQPTTKFDFGRSLAGAFGFDPELVRPATASSVLSVKRGSNLSLDTSKAESFLGKRLATQQEGVAALVSDFAAGRPQQLVQFI